MPKHRDQEQQARRKTFHSHLSSLLPHSGISGAYPAIQIGLRDGRKIPHVAGILRQYGNGVGKKDAIMLF